MAQITENQIEKDLQKGWKGSFLLLAGPELFKVERLRKLLQKKLPASTTTVRLHAETWADEAYVEHLQSLTLFHSATFVWISEAEKLSTKAWDTVLESLDAIPEGVQVLVTLDQVDGRRSYATKLNKHRSAGIVRCEWADQAEFQQWARELAQGRKRKISAEACQALWERVGPSLLDLDQALEKVTLFDPSNAPIDVDTIAAVVAHTRPELVFAFTDALAAHDLRATHAALSTLLAQGEEPIALVALIGRQYRWLYEMDARHRNGENLDDIVRSLGIYPRVSKSLVTTLRRQKTNGIAHGLEAIRQADLALKSSSEPPRLVLDRLAYELLARSAP